MNVSFPWWAYLIPGAAIGLPIAASMAEARARASFRRGIGKVDFCPVPQPEVVID